MKKEVLIFLLIGLVAFSPVVDAFSFSEAFGNILDFFKDLFKRTVGSFILLTPSDVSAEKSGDNQIRVSWDYFTCDAGYPINSPPTITLISPTGRTTGVPDNSPPTITLISPLGAAASVSINPTLTWDGYDADGDNILYILYLKDSESTTWQTYPLQQETYTVQNLEFNTIYNWKVSVVAGTDTVVSDPRTFTTMEEGLGYLNEDLYFEVYRDDSRIETVSAEQNGCNFIDENLQPGTYIYKVRAKKGSQFSDFSSPSSPVQIPELECNIGDTQPCDTGYDGICSEGTQTCDNGNEWGSCTQNSPSSAEIECDNIDQNCDGSDLCTEIICDEGDTQPCDTGYDGICSEGTQTCDNGNEWGSCTQNSPSSAEIECDNIDQNCDGSDLCTEIICDDEIDNDNNGVKDCFDIGCQTDSACLSHSFFLEDIQGDDLEETFYLNTEISNILCYYNGIAGENDLSISSCINLNVSGIDCQNKDVDSVNNIVVFNGCNVGLEIGERAIACRISEKCSAQAPIEIASTINVMEFTSCNLDDEDLGQTNQDQITNFGINYPEVNDDFNAGDKFSAEIEFTNNYNPGEPTEYTAEAFIVNIVDYSEITSKSEAIAADYLEDIELTISNISIPQSLNSSEYELNIKVYETGSEDVLCISKGVMIEINEFEEPETFLPEAEEEGLPVQQDSQQEGSQGSQNQFNQPQDSNIRSDYNEQNSSGKALIIIVIIGAVLLLAIVAYIIIRGRMKRGRGLEVPKFNDKDPLEGMISRKYILTPANENKIKDYIRTSKSNGVNDKEIKNSLLSAGWSEEDINKFL